MTDQQVLETIERIAGDDFCEEISMRGLRPDDPRSDDLKTAANKLSAIYRIAHSAVRSHTCFQVHESWRQEAEHTHDALVALIVTG